MGQAAKLRGGWLRVCSPRPFQSVLDIMADAAMFCDPVAGRLAMTTDSFVVQPLRFPGGSIGELAVNGTVNDLAVSGATPIALTAAFILEAGLDRDVLRARSRSHGRCRPAWPDVPIVAGDTKVVEHGKADGMYISTTGLGLVDAACRSGARPRARRPTACYCPGRSAIMAWRSCWPGPISTWMADIRSDTRPLTDLGAAHCSTSVGHGLEVDARCHARRRGHGAERTGPRRRTADRHLREEAIPVDDVVRGGCELLGLDPLHVANEGQFIAIVSADCAAAALKALRATPGGERACHIGEVIEGRLAASWPRPRMAECGLLIC